MASKAKKGDPTQPNLKICIDNRENVSEVEDGEVEDSSDESTKRITRKSPPTERMKRYSEAREDHNLKHDRPLPSPVESDDDNPLTVDMDDLETFGVVKKPKPKVYENPSQNSFVLGFDPTSEEAIKKKEERAKRFGIPAALPNTSKVDDEELKKLYSSLGLSDLETSAGFGERGIRLEAVHLRGTDNMSTEDVFSYFQEFTPKSIEWIDDSSCNVIWHSRESAARAILNKSTDPNKTNDDSKETTVENMETDEKEEKKDSKEEDDTESTKNEEKPMEPEGEDDDDLNLMSSDDEESQTKCKINEEEQKHEEMDKQQQSNHSDKETSHKTENVPTDKVAQDATPTTKPLYSSSNLIKRILPPGNWRIGQECEKAKFLFMRFANKADRKLPGAEKKSQYYRQYGNPNFGGIKGLISSSRKRRLINNQNRREIQEARRAVRKTEKFYHGVPEETTFDQHLREAKRAKNMYTVASGKSDDDNYEDDMSDNGNTYMLNQYDEEEENTAWGRLSNDEQSDKPEGQEEELDLELELGELMKKVPTYRVGRMYADDLEEEIRVKREAAEELAKEVLAKTDARGMIERNRSQKVHRHHHRHHRRRHRSDSDNGASDEECETMVVEDSDVRNRTPKHKTHRSHHKRRKEHRLHHRSDRRRADIDENSPDEDIITTTRNTSESNFKYEKLRIQVDPDDS